MVTQGVLGVTLSLPINQVHMHPLGAGLPINAPVLYHLDLVFVSYCCLFLKLNLITKMWSQELCLD